MSDAAEAGTDTPKTSSKKPLFALLAVVALVGGSYVIGQTVVAKEFAKEQLDGWIANAEAHAKTQGVHMDIAYGNLAFEGSAPPTAKLSNVTVQFASFVDAERETPSADDAVHVRTAALVLEPTSLGLTSFDISAPEPIHVRYGQDAFDAVKLAAPTPLQLSARQEETAHGTKLSLKHPLPKLLNLAMQDNSVASPVAYELSFAGSSELASSLILEAPHLGETHIRLNGMQFTASDVALLNIGNGEVEWQKYPNKKGAEISHSFASLKDISGEAMHALGSATLTWNVHTVSMQTPATEDNPFGISSASVDVKKLKLHAQGTSIALEGEFASDGMDFLPVGHADISVKNPNKLREFLAANGMLTADNEVLLDKLLNGMTGRGINEEGDIAIAVSREKEGAFMLGKLSFEEALGILLSHRMAQQPLPLSIPENAEPATN